MTTKQKWTFSILVTALLCLLLSTTTRSQTRGAWERSDDYASCSLDCAPEALPYAGGYPLEVQFESYTMSHGCTNITYSWDFGDGSTSTEENPVHVYTAPGEFVWSLTISVDEGWTCPDNPSVGTIFVEDVAVTHVCIDDHERSFVSFNIDTGDWVWYDVETGSLLSGNGVLFYHSSILSITSVPGEPWRLGLRFNTWTNLLYGSISYRAYRLRSSIYSSGN